MSFYRWERVDYPLYFGLLHWSLSKLALAVNLTQPRTTKEKKKESHLSDHIRLACELLGEEIVLIFLIHVGEPSTLWIALISEHGPELYKKAR